MSLTRSSAPRTPTTPRRERDRRCSRTGLSTRGPGGFRGAGSPVAGDLGRPRLGARDQDWAWLARAVSGISIHCARRSTTSSPMRRCAARTWRARSTLIRLALRGHAEDAAFRVDHVHVPGFVAGTSAVETDANVEMAGLNFGYAQTQVGGRAARARRHPRAGSTAESTGRRSSRRRGGRPLRRTDGARSWPTLIPARRVGRSRPTRSASCRWTCAPITSSRSRCSTTAADDVPPHGGRLLHDAGSLLGHRRAVGYRFEYISLERFVGHMNAHCTKGDPLFPLVAFFNQNYRQSR